MSASEASAGLVSTSTSHTAVRREAVEFNTRTARYRRMRYNVIAASTMLNAAASGWADHKLGHSVFVTLTYRPGVVPEPKHISRYTANLCAWFSRRDIRARYAWVAELTQRGVLHYHVIVWVPFGYKLPMPDRSGWWRHGHSKIERARAAVGYLAHYAGKLKSKGGDLGMAMPQGFRLYGIGGLDVEDRQRRAWANLPAWLRERVTPAERCKRISGGGFVSRETLEHWPSPWRIGRVVRVGGGALVTLLPALPQGVELCSPW